MKQFPEWCVSIRYRALATMITLIIYQSWLERGENDDWVVSSESKWVWNCWKLTAHSHYQCCNVWVSWIVIVILLKWLLLTNIDFMLLLHIRNCIEFNCRLWILQVWSQLKAYIIFAYFSYAFIHNCLISILAFINFI